jgi:hypothetical protein
MAKVVSGQQSKRKANFVTMLIKEGDGDLHIG